MREGMRERERVRERREKLRGRGGGGRVSRHRTVAQPAVTAAHDGAEHWAGHLRGNSGSTFEAKALLPGAQQAEVLRENQ